MTLALSWSGGKDSAWALEALRDAGDPPDVLFTTFTEPDDEVTLHRVPAALVRAQAAAVGLELVEMRIPVPCPNAVYAARMDAALAGPLAEVDRFAFGDLHLADIRAFREERLASRGREAIFPLWGRDTAALARGMVRGGLRAVVCTVDTEQLDAEVVGREFDDALLDELPPDVDPCGENGELHTFVTDAPAFARPVEVTAAGRQDDGRFVSVRLAPAQEAAARSWR